MSKDRALDLIKRLATDKEFRSRLNQKQTVGKRELLDRSGFPEVGAGDLRAAAAALRGVPQGAGAVSGGASRVADGLASDVAAFGAAAFGSAAFGSAAFGSAAFGSAAFGSAAFGSAAFGASTVGGKAVA